MKTSLLLLLALLASALARAVPTPALIIAGYDPSGTTSNSQSQTNGWAFQAATNITITALGLFDYGSDGLADAHTLGLWSTTLGSNSGTLLASATVPEGTASPLQGQFRYVDIAPITLQAGELYVIGAHYTGLSGGGSLDPDPEDRDLSISEYTTLFYATNTEILFRGNRSSSQQTTGLNFPYYAGIPGFGTSPRLGPNFLYTVAPSSVPEGGATGLMALALAGMLVAGGPRLRRQMAA